MGGLHHLTVTALRRRGCCNCCLLCCKRIFERNATQRPRWRETRRDGSDRRLIAICAVETREATRDGDRLAHNPEVAGSNPVPATEESGPDQAKRPQHQLAAGSFCELCERAVVGVGRS
jgi:hypothetical protein